MANPKTRMKDALFEAVINGIVIFALSVGVMILTKTAGMMNTDASYGFILLQSTGLALLRLATYMMQQSDKVSAGGLDEYISGASGSKRIVLRCRYFFENNRVGKLI